ncbi:hypothetical protein DIJ69_33525 [Streptomyces globisporus]|nr:hypothetical protein DIJ69_33525 [Streptomyces globisporus]
MTPVLLAVRPACDGPGYALRAGRVAVDAWRFEDAVARAGHPERQPVRLAPSVRRTRNRPQHRLRQEAGTVEPRSGTAGERRRPKAGTALVPSPSRSTTPSEAS